MASQEYAGFKVVLCGDAGTGKTSIRTVMNGDQFEERPMVTIGVEFSIVTRQLDDAADGTTVKLIVHDVAGADRLSAFLSQTFRDAHAIVAVYDICRPETFDHALLWIKKAQNVHSNFDPYVIVVGNKLDLAAEERAVRTEDVRVLCAALNFCFLELSAKDNTNVDTLIATLCSELYALYRHRMGPLRGSAIRMPLAVPRLPVPTAGAEANVSPGRVLAKMGIRDPGADTHVVLPTPRLYEPRLCLSASAPAPIAEPINIADRPGRTAPPSSCCRN
jgi:small GTP-binding protein